MGLREGDERGGVGGVEGGLEQVFSAVYFGK